MSDAREDLIRRCKERATNASNIGGLLREVAAYLADAPAPAEAPPCEHSNWRLGVICPDCDQAPADVAARPAPLPADAPPLLCKTPEQVDAALDWIAKQPDEPDAAAPARDALVEDDDDCDVPMGLSVDPEVMHGRLCIAGTRIPVSAVQNYHAAGYSRAKIMQDYPDLTREQIDAALAPDVKQWLAARLRDMADGAVYTANELHARLVEAAAALAQRDVPRAPTTAMLQAGAEAHVSSGRGNWLVRIWIAMYDAAPQGRSQRDDDARAIADIAAERERQKSVEGWTEQHDDKHDDGALAVAAACYALHGAADSAGAEWATEYRKIARHAWPYDGEWWKPKDARRDLVRAGALIVAEIERLDRAAMQEERNG